jgi:hypothetical protein
MLWVQEHNYGSLVGSHLRRSRPHVNTKHLNSAETLVSQSDKTQLL